MSIGVLAHCFGRLPLSELSYKVGSYGFSYVQLALSKALSDVDCSLGKLSPGLANHIAEAFARQNVRIAVLGCYVNLMETDPERLRNNVEQFKEHLRMARHFGNAVVATEVGIPSAQNPDANWKQLQEVISELAEEAEKWGADMAIEAANRHFIQTAEELAELVERVPSDHVGTLIDPCNILTPDNFHKQDEVMRRAFELLGSRLMSLHAKDVQQQQDGSLHTVAAGSGQLNYELFMKLAEQVKPHSYVTLEAVEVRDMLAAAQAVESWRRNIISEL